MLLTVEERTAFDRAKHAKAIRVTLYELGIFIGALWLADKAMAMWPQYALGILGAMVGAWVGLIILRYRDFRSLEFIEERLGEDEASGTWKPPSESVIRMTKETAEAGLWLGSL